MSAQQPASLTEWYQNLPLSWYGGAPNSHAEVTALGSFLDSQVALVKLATKAHMPSYAPTDALPHIGGDRQLEQGPNETNASFVTRLKAAWGSWSHAGTAVELLAQLYYGGFPGAVIAQQNGLLYNLTAAPTPGVDPTPLLNIALAAPNWSIVQKPNYSIFVVCNGGGTLGTATFNITTNGTSTIFNATPAASTTAALYPVTGAYTWLRFPAGTYSVGDNFTINADGTTSTASTGPIATLTFNSAPWWTIDANNAHTSRFLVLFPSTGGSFTTTGTAVFTGAENGTTVPWPTVTWSNAFPDATYKTQCGPAVVTDGGGAVIVDVDGTTKTQTGAQVVASDSFVGTVDVLAYQASATNPFADAHDADLARLRRLINRWRPAKAICSGITVIVKAPVWGWPVSTTWGQSGLLWGTGISVKYGA